MGQFSEISCTLQMSFRKPFRWWLRRRIEVRGSQERQVPELPDAHPARGRPVGHQDPVCREPGDQHHGAGNAKDFRSLRKPNRRRHQAAAVRSVRTSISTFTSALVILFY